MEASASGMLRGKAGDRLAWLVQLLWTPVMRMEWIRGRRIRSCVFHAELKTSPAAIGITGRLERISLIGRSRSGMLHADAGRTAFKSSQRKSFFEHQSISGRDSMGLSVQLATVRQMQGILSAFPLPGAMTYPSRNHMIAWWLRPGTRRIKC
jgi:hypothetical protein